MPRKKAQDRGSSKKKKKKKSEAQKKKADYVQTELNLSYADAKGRVRAEATPEPYQSAEGSQASWSERDNEFAFKDTTELEEQLRREPTDHFYDVETILRWRRNPRNGQIEYRAVWQGFTIRKHIQYLYRLSVLHAS